MLANGRLTTVASTIVVESRALAPTELVNLLRMGAFFVGRRAHATIGET